MANGQHIQIWRPGQNDGWDHLCPRGKDKGEFGKWMGSVIPGAAVEVDLLYKKSKDAIISVLYVDCIEEHADSKLFAFL